MSQPEPFANVASLEAFLELMGRTPSSEAEGLTELDHGLQCAAELRGLAPDDLELQVAGLLHDVGHTVSHIRDHGVAGASLVRDLMGDRIAELVALHIPAKRYLVTTDPTYRARLSPESIRTLALQGGDMSDVEVAAFDAEPHGKAGLDLRRADEAAKVVGADVPDLDYWRPALRQFARA
ncbi:MAG: metal-dependent phosphohydrolase [Alphaproteobacteria bacterium PA2]|nr:MAG: metal-dependent phosphohydrolase [Alphaproteobacteria bacterium PA2]